jgi:hypothetical protein
LLEQEFALSLFLFFHNFFLDFFLFESLLFEAFPLFLFFLLKFFIIRRFGIRACNSPEVALKLIGKFEKILIGRIEEVWIFNHSVDISIELLWCGVFGGLEFELNFGEVHGLFDDLVVLGDTESLSVNRLKEGPWVFMWFELLQDGDHGFECFRNLLFVSFFRLGFRSLFRLGCILVSGMLGEWGFESSRTVRVDILFGPGRELFELGFGLLDDGAWFGEEVCEGFGLDLREFAVESVSGRKVPRQFTCERCAVH